VHLVGFIIKKKVPGTLSTGVRSLDAIEVQHSVSCSVVFRTH
jgi:hypothetical protein